METSHFGIFRLIKERNNILLLERAKIDLLKDKRPINRLLVSGHNLWIYIYFNVIVAPIFWAIIFFPKKLDEVGKFIFGILLFLPISWILLKSCINYIWPQFYIKVDANKKILSYRSTRLSSKFFSWKETAHIPFHEISSVKTGYNIAGQVNGGQYAGLSLFLSILKTDNTELRILSKHFYSTKVKKQSKNEKPKFKDPIASEVYADFTRAATLIAQYADCKIQQPTENK